MCLHRAVVAAVLLCAAAWPQTVPLSEFKQRRDELRRSFQAPYARRDMGDALVVAFGATEGGGGELRTGFFQDPDFYYLTGWTEPGAILVMTPKQDILLLPKRNEQQERWTGPKLAPGDAGVEKKTGFDVVLATTQLESKLLDWSAEASTIATFGDTVDRLKQLMPLRRVVPLDASVRNLRGTKSAAEIAAIQHATDVTNKAHLAAWERLRPGVYEYEVAAAMSNVYFAGGCERHAYSPIVGSGANAAILHYSKNSRRMDSGELVLMDVGAECGMYASDITRTVPVTGRFTARQRELYEVVLGAQKAAIAAIRPGVAMNRTAKSGIHQIAYDYINTHGRDLKGEPLGKYFIHGLSHHVGLEVHDAGPETLAEGNVITVEPGIYIPEEGIGIRIEDIVLVTKDGAKVLSASLPKEASEIEKLMARSK